MTESVPSTGVEPEMLALEEDTSFGNSNENKTPMKVARGTKRKCISPLTPGDLEITGSTKKRRKSTSSVSLGQVGSPLLKPALTERQQMALIMQMTDPHKQGTLSGGEESVTSTPRSDPSWTPRSRILRRNERGETLLHTACIKGDIKSASTLIEQGADVNSADNAGWTPLHEACNYGHVKVVSFLLKQQAEVNARGMDGDTPLHDAAMNGHVETVKLLLEYNGNPYQENDQGHTPIDVCTHKEILHLMRAEKPRPSFMVGSKIDSEEEDVFVLKDKRVKSRDQSHFKVGSSKGSSRSSLDSDREDERRDDEDRRKGRSLYRDGGSLVKKITTTPVGVYSTGMDRNIGHTPKSRPRNVLYSDLSSSESDGEHSDLSGGHGRGRYLAKRGEVKQKLLGKLDESKEADNAIKEGEGHVNDSDGCGRGGEEFQTKESLPDTNSTTTIQSANHTTKVVTPPSHQDNKSLSPTHHHPSCPTEVPCSTTSTTTTITDVTLTPPPSTETSSDSSSDDDHDDDDMTQQSQKKPSTETNSSHDFKWESQQTTDSASCNGHPEALPPSKQSGSCEEEKINPPCPEFSPDDPKHIKPTSPPPAEDISSREGSITDMPPGDEPPEATPTIPLPEATRRSSGEEEGENGVAPTRLLRSSVKKLNVPMDEEEEGSDGEGEGLVVSWSLALVRSCNTSPERDSKVYRDEARRHSDTSHAVSEPTHLSLSRFERIDSRAPERCNSTSSADTCFSASGSEVSHTTRHGCRAPHKIPESREMEKGGAGSMNVSVNWGVLASKNGSLTHPLEAPKKEGKGEGSTVISLPLLYTGRSDSIDSTTSMPQSPSQSHDGYPGNTKVESDAMLKVAPSSSHVVKTQDDMRSFLINGEGMPPSNNEMGVASGSVQATPDASGERDTYHRTSSSSSLPPRKWQRPVFKSTIVHQRQKCHTPTISGPTHLSSFLMYCGNYRSKQPFQPTNPKLVYPPLIPSMYKLFSEQENDRIKLISSHLTEQDRMILCMEQELLRAHQRATKNSATISACSVLLENLLQNVDNAGGVVNGCGLDGLHPTGNSTSEAKSSSEEESVDCKLLSGLVQDVWDKFQDLRFTLLTRQRHEAESLWLIQHLQWKERISELGVSRSYSAGHEVPRTHIPLALSIGSSTHT